MNRQSILKRTWLVVTAGSLLCWLVGCQPHATADYDLARAALAQQKVQDIEPLKLEEADPNEVPPADANEPPPEELALGLEACRALALENSLELKAVLINPTIAAERLNAEEAKFEAAFLANVNYGKTNTPSVSYLDQISGSKVDYLRSGLGVEVPLRTGGTVSLDMVDMRTRTNAEFTDFNPYYMSDLSASISQPLLRNAGRWANTHSIRIVAYDRQITDARTQLEVITVLAALDRVYWRLYAARKELDVRKQQHDLAQAQLEQARRLVNAGERSQVEIIRAEAGVAQQLEAIIVAENNLRDRERDLKRVMNKSGLNMQSPTVLTPTTEPDPVLYDLDRVALVRTALDSRMELLELQLQLLRDGSTLDYMRNQALPLATLSYTYNINGLGATRADSFDLLLENDFADHRAGLQVRIPIGNEAAKSRLRQAIYQRRATLATQASRKATIEHEVLASADQVEANWQRILAARQNSILNGRLYQAERRQFELKMRTSTDVLNAQTMFADAQSAEIQALTEYQISLVDLAYATGTLLGAARVHWEPIVPAAD